MIQHSATFLTERPAANPKAGDDERSEFDRDYARIIHSAAFRRLQSKTQVLGLGESDFYRTRLTHSMEVAQIGCGIVRHLEKMPLDPELAAILPPAALMNSICLAHDIGHPPFGHGGEIALNYCMRAFGGFEGNGQSLRILTSLETYTENRGMNLTRRALLGILKYPAPYSELAASKPDEGHRPNQPGWMFKSADHKPPKGYLDTEKALVKGWLLAGEFKADAALFTGIRPPEGNRPGKTRYKGFDTSIMELADDISYGVHDLEDAISMDLVRRRDFETYLDEETASGFLKAAGIDFSRLLDGLFGEEDFRRKQLIGRMVHYLINQISTAVQNSHFKSPLFRYQASLSAEASPMLESLKTLVLDRVIRSSAVQQLEFKGQKLVVELFEVLAHDPDRLLPESILRRFREKGRDPRVLCDYVAGMSDNHAVRLYQKIFTPQQGSIFDRY
ncbi:anti-phage deoxyguanosine triphosphatase [Aestuariispira insulae]|uniref:Deoxyguanosinetriphosphate triphosphohydrolase-like protein n=1 Tax=Aestuariispira insulae TaxID=1461337 RepID=A0A3D9HSG7_9PROT|nr:anti-phage deoxyguanosine triphosphatase [Aestuariispira insulae]RED52365.1 dGTPase [Aestuariispira insulae]